MTKVDKQSKNKTSKITISDEYFQYLDKYQEKYGDKTIVLMQVGSFHEIYSCEVRKKNQSIYQIADMLNLVVSRKDKSIPVSESNHLMCGWPCGASSKFLKILVDNQYTVVVIDQVTPPPNPARAVTGVYSPSTYIDNVGHENKYLMVMYIELIGSNGLTNLSNLTNQSNQSNQIDQSQPILQSISNISIGMCAIDSSTGEVFYYESHGTGLLDENEAFEEAQRFYHYYRPVELIVYQIDSNSSNSNCNSISYKKKLIEKIDLLPNQILFQYEKINPSYTKISYQNTLLKKVYTECGMVSPIEYLDMERYSFATIALITGIDYIYQHNENLIKDLGFPKYFNDHKYMVLGNNAQYQLNIIDYYNWDLISTKYQSLNDVVNNCITPMGKRALKKRLCAPYTNAKIISRYYDLTEKMLNEELYEKCRMNMKGICDLDKLFRKLSIKFIQPYELYTISETFELVVKTTQLLLESKLRKDVLKLMTKAQISEFNDAYEYVEKTFDLEKLKTSNLVEVKESFYLKGIHKNIDEIVEKIETSIGFIDKLTNALEKYDPTISLQTKHNDRDGYYLTTTKIRGQKLKELIDKDENKLIVVTENISIKKEDLIFTYQTSTTKISYPGLSDHSDEIEELYAKLNDEIKKTFYIDTNNWYNKYVTVFKSVIQLITEIDLISNNAWVSKKYHYTKPKIISEEESIVRAKNLRHPIVERIIDYEYVPNDAYLDNDTRGNMIYGVNSVGKSVNMKSVGISLIMAQSGLYVPAENYEYGIFESLYTRISGSDNLFKGQSSFVVEMNELRTILKKSNSRSLIIGDEICRGTEYLSANAIVAATILKLVDLKAKFLFATHLHDLVKINRINNLGCLKFYYLSVTKVGDQLVFNRKMTEGTGEQIYGITIAKYILDDPIFINTAVELKNEMLESSGVQTKLVSDKKTNYNSDMYMDECSICGNKVKLETHHINYQKDFVESKSGLIHKDKKHILKDSKANLVNLCEKCHDELHADKIKIKGKTRSTKGTIVLTE